jgi:tRNA(fMet)-specific endonuclease VapC
MSELYMLDTDMLSFLIKRRRSVVAMFFAMPLEQLCVSVITEAEQRAGLEKVDPDSRLYSATMYFLGHIAILPWDSDAAIAYAPIRHQLGLDRQQIGDLDTMIAAHAMSIGATLVTNNIRHFRRIAGGPKLENWLES